MKNILRKNLGGFTLIEILVAVSIVAVISITATVSFGSVRSKLRDSQRISDIKKIVVALEKYRRLNGGYPSCLTGTEGYTNGSSYTCDYMDKWDSCLGEKLKPYLNEMPSDPDSSFGAYCYSESYVYNPGNRRVYLRFYLEDSNPNTISDNAIYFVSFNSIYSSYFSVHEIMLQQYRSN